METFVRLLFPQPALALACLLAGGCLSGAALGQNLSGSYVSPQKPADEYLDAIDLVEADHGPYAMELSDLFLGLGQTLIDAGEYEQAREAFLRGVMVQRVNMGPNSPEQTNHLYLLANIETVLGDFMAADKAMRNVYFINSQHFGEDSAEMLPVLKRMYQWYHVARPLGSDISEFPDYLRNIEITEEIVRVSELVNGEGHPDTAQAYRRLGEANFQAVKFLLEQEMWMHGDPYLAIRKDPLLPAELQNYSIGEYYNDGRHAFRVYHEWLSTNESMSPAEHAAALADLGDWYLTIEKYSRSQDFYEEGYKILAESEGHEDLVSTYMNEPGPMHFMADLPPAVAEDVPEGFQGLNLDVTMTVTSAGNLRQIEFPNAPEELSKDELKNIRNQLQKIPFRPAIKDGEIVTTKDFNWRYRVAPRDEAS